MLRRGLLGGWLTVLLVAALAVLPTLEDATAGRSDAITGAYGRLLTGATDLGPSTLPRAGLTAALRTAAPPELLTRWAHREGLDVRWREGDDWAFLEGAPADVANAFGVPVHDYRGPRGQVFYASPRQPVVPSEVRATVSAVGRILGYTPHREAGPAPLPLDVPFRGLTPLALLEAYNASSIVRQGFTGGGQTIVVFAFGGYEQTDLDDFAAGSGLPPLRPTVVGGMPEGSSSETVMDLQVVHAVAPDARKVVVNARSTLEGGRTYERIGEMFDAANRDFPGAVWSLSIGWGCDALITATDLKPVQAALERALANGTSAFDASGDTAGLECKGGDGWSAPPGPDDIGLDAVASLPAMTSVGGTTLSTDEDGRWAAEQAWFDGPLSQGTSGGVSRLFPRPLWQQGIVIDRDRGRKLRRLAPDISAVADPFTGVRIRYDGQDLIGAGTSQAAPIWAGLTAIMNQYLIANGGRSLGDINPLLYRVAAGANSPGFRDVSLGATAVDLSGRGYDLATGLGSPNVDALVRDFLDIQRRTAPR